MLTALALLCALAFQDAPTKLHFEAPAASSEDDAKKAAAALQARCATYGYQGITVKAERAKDTWTVSLEWPNGFNAQMRATVTLLAQIPGQKVEVLATHALPDPLKEQFTEVVGAKRILSAKAPQGWRWFVDLGLEVPHDLTQYLEGEVRGKLFLTSPSVPRPVFAKLGKDGKVSFSIPKDAAKRFLDMRDQLNARGVVDFGIAVTSEEYVVSYVSTVDLSKDPCPVEVTNHAKAILSHLLPFALKPAK